MSSAQWRDHYGWCGISTFPRTFTATAATSSRSSSRSRKELVGGGPIIVVPVEPSRAGQAWADRSHRPPIRGPRQRSRLPQIAQGRRRSPQARGGERSEPEESHPASLALLHRPQSPLVDDGPLHPPHAAPPELDCGQLAGPHQPVRRSMRHAELGRDLLEGQEPRRRRGRVPEPARLPERWGVGGPEPRDPFCRTACVTPSIPSPWPLSPHGHYS